MEDLVKYIEHFLPNCIVKEQLLKKLDDLGVTCSGDLSFVTPTELSPPLKIVEARKLLAVPEKTSKQATAAPVFEEKITESSKSDLPHSSMTDSPGHKSSMLNKVGALNNLSWDDFVLPWDTLPKSLRASLQQNKRLSPPDRRCLVRQIIEVMKQTVQNPSKADVAKVALLISKQYPNCLNDTIGPIEINTINSFITQLKCRVEHTNRTNTLLHRRRSVKKSSNGPTVADQYGCIQWQPEMPDSETDETLNDNKQRLLDLYKHHGPTDDLPEVDKLMNNTYHSQRLVINCKPPVPILELKQQWPYLFHVRYLLAHFQTLTGIAIKQKLIEQFETTGKLIISYFREHVTNDDVRSVIQMSDDYKQSLPIHVLLILLAHFKENKSGLFILTDVSSTMYDVENGPPLPDTPRLIIPGTTLLNGNRWMASVDEHVVYEGSQLNTAVAALFAVYYVYNIKYQADTSATLEFIKRGLVGINPIHGSKATAKTRLNPKTGKSIVRRPAHTNTNVETLLQKLSDYKSGCKI